MPILKRIVNQLSTFCLRIGMPVFDPTPVRLCLGGDNVAHSVRKDLTGFIKAALTAWKLVVATAKIIAPTAVTTNTAGCIEV
jgi:hypothetical protein